MKKIFQYIATGSILAILIMAAIAAMAAVGYFYPIIAQWTNLSIAMQLVISLAIFLILAYSIMATKMTVSMLRIYKKEI